MSEKESDASANELPYYDGLLNSLGYATMMLANSDKNTSQASDSSASSRSSAKRRKVYSKTQKKSLSSSKQTTRPRASRASTTSSSASQVPSTSSPAAPNVQPAQPLPPLLPTSFPQYNSRLAAAFTNPQPAQTVHLVEVTTIPKIYEVTFIHLAEQKDKIQRKEVISRKMHGAKYFIYFYLDKALIPNIRIVTFEQFVKALRYIGKGESGRPFEHVKDMVDVKIDGHTDHTKTAAKTAGIWSLLDGNSPNGIIIHVTCFYNHEYEAYNREGSVIDLLKSKGELWNTDAGRFPGVDMLSYDPSTRKNVLYLGDYYDDKNKTIFEGRQIFGLQTLIHAFGTFVCQNVRVIKNMKDAIDLRDETDLPLTKKTDTVDQTDAFSYYTLLTNTDYSHHLELAVNGIPTLSNSHYNVTQYFDKKPMQKYFVYIYCDGSKLSDLKYGEQVTFSNYLESIFCIGVERNFTQPFDFLNVDVDNKDITVAVKDVFKKNEGLFVQAMFSLSNFDDATLRKACMVAALRKNFLDDANFIRKSQKALSNTATTSDFYETLGAYCLHLSHTAFNAEQPRRLRQKDIF